MKSQVAPGSVKLDPSLALKFLSWFGHRSFVFVGFSGRLPLLGTHVFGSSTARRWECACHGILMVGPLVPPKVEAWKTQRRAARAIFTDVDFQIEMTPVSA